MELTEAIEIARQLLVDVDEPAEEALEALIACDCERIAVEEQAKKAKQAEPSGEVAKCPDCSSVELTRERGQMYKCSQCGCKFDQLRGIRPLYRT